MLAFHGKPEIKQFYMDRVRKHREADELIQGTAWYAGRGCAVGCTLEEYDHEKYPKLLGVPAELAYLQDALFEGLAKEDALAFPEQFLGAIPVGSDLSMVLPHFALWVLADQENGVLRFVTDRLQREAIQAVVDLYRDWIDMRVVPSQPRWETAASSAIAAGRWGYVEASAEEEEKAETGRAACAVAGVAAESAFRGVSALKMINFPVALIRRRFPSATCLRWKLSARDTLLKLLAEAPVA
jgi:hypothetical protein